MHHARSCPSASVGQFAGRTSGSLVGRPPAHLLPQVERERGITVRAQSASMIYDDERTKTPYLLNLVDTPGAEAPAHAPVSPTVADGDVAGHVDFSYEVRRALAACQGAVLLVDASQGIQAQTLAHYQAALEAGLEVSAHGAVRAGAALTAWCGCAQIIPVLSKVDLPHAEPENVIKQMQATIGELQCSPCPPMGRSCGARRRAASRSLAHVCQVWHWREGAFPRHR